MNSDPTKLDKLLDDALRNYSEAEPRIGFESRIIANLRTAPAQPWWHRRLAYASVAAVVVLVGVFCRSFDRVSPGQPPPVIVMRLSPPATVQIAPAGSRSKRPVRQVRAEAVHEKSRTPVLQTQLPAPVPLTQQEKLLLAFAHENPTQVVISAQWQEQMRQRPVNPDLPDQGEQQ
jgi:hypothetical protein